MPEDNVREKFYKLDISATKLPVNVNVRSNHQIDEEDTKDDEIGTIVNGVLYEGCLELASHSEIPCRSIRLHHGQQQPTDKQSSYQSLGKQFKELNIHDQHLEGIDTQHCRTRARTSKFAKEFKNRTS